jgi:hypothetical protein
VAGVDVVAGEDVVSGLLMTVAVVVVTRVISQRPPWSTNTIGPVSRI